MEKVKLGQKAARFGIQRVTCADGQKIRMVLLDFDPRFKYVAYDEIHKCRVEVDQEMCLRYNLKPSTIYLYLVAKLNTDLNGKIVGDDFTIEYLQLSENLNSDFADALQEIDECKSIVGSKVKKTVEGRDFSYITVKPSGTGIDGSLKQKIDAIRENPEFIEATWALIDAATSLTREQYEYRITNGNPQLTAKQDNASRQLEAARQATAPKIPQQVIPEVKPEDNDFGGSDDDFGDWK